MPVIDDFTRAQPLSISDHSTAAVIAAAHRTRGEALRHGRRLDGMEGRMKARPAANLQIVLHVAAAIALVTLAVLLPSLLVAGASFLI